MTATRSSRRRFLKGGAAAAAAGWAVALPDTAVPGAPAGVAGAAGPENSVIDNNSMEAVLYGRRSRFVTTVRDLEGGGQHDGGVMHADPHRPSAGTPLAETFGVITPTSLHYATQHNYGIPDINPAQHRFMISGLVDRPKVFTMDELKRYPAVSRIYFIECIGNKHGPSDRRVSQSHGRIACNEWTGVPLSVLLQEAGVQKGGEWVIAEAVGGGMFDKSVPMIKAMDDVLVAYAQNGEPVRPDHGFPLRLVVPGFEGIYQVKWLRSVKVVDRPALTFQENSRFTGVEKKQREFMYEMWPKSVITFPSGEHRLTEQGNWTIRGLAWSGAGAIARVEVSTDGGKTWNDAKLREPRLPRAFTCFDYVWKWTGQEAELWSRCTDEVGQIQPTVEEFAKFWSLTVPQVYSSPGSRWGGANYIMSWKVGADGSVSNGLVGVSGPREG